MHITTILAIKYLFSIKQEKSISLTIKICMLGILIGTVALTLTMSIINGFEEVMIEKMKSFYPQIILENQNNFLNTKKISEILKSEFTEIDSFSPNNIQYSILQKNTEQDINNVVILKAIDSEQEQKVMNLESKIIQKLYKDLNFNIFKNRILIGEKIAKNFNLKIGEKINLLFPDESSDKQIKFNKKQMIISGIFKTGLDEFDSKLIFISLNFLKENFNQESTQIGIKLKPYTNELQTIEKLKQRFKMNVYSWKDLQPSLLSAIKLEKYIMCFIIFLILLISTNNIISLILMLIMQKQLDLAILKSMGLSYKNLKLIFIKIGLIISSISIFIGLIISYFLCVILKKYEFIELPDVYYVNTLPVKIDSFLFLLVFVLIFLITFIALIIPINRIKTLNIANILKFE